MNSESAPAVLVLGASGLIGAACARALLAAGFQVTGVGRSRHPPRFGISSMGWRCADLVRLDRTGWLDLTAGAAVVVNAAGALQDGAGDRLASIHDHAVGELVAALEGCRTRLVQISAAGVSPEAPTKFFRSKALGDARIMASGISWIILRPALVIGPQASGGTALLRACAGFPLIRPRVLDTAPVQTVALADVADAVLRAAKGEVPIGTIADLTEIEVRPFADLVVEMRSWLGLPGWRASLPLPGWAMRAAAITADGLGWLGWRSPLRTSALMQLRAGIAGDPARWNSAGGRPCRSLQETLAELPATAQERLFARLWLAMPLVLGGLALFWMLSGVIGLAEQRAARSLLEAHGLSVAQSAMVVWGGGVLDLALGLGVLVRRSARTACLGMFALSLAYLVGGSLVAPELWAEPLGPLLKILPTALLALIGAALVEPR